jgi:hypothetical protein
MSMLIENDSQPIAMTDNVKFIKRQINFPISKDEFSASREIKGRGRELIFRGCAGEG